MIRLASSSDDAAAFFEHVQRHAAESGRDGDIIFSPLEIPTEDLLNDYQSRVLKGWTKSPQEVGWSRTWFFIEDSCVRGHIDLVHRPPLSTSLHRATLMLGIERPYRQRGLGHRLIREALNWAKMQNQIEWIDLQVFEHNTKARALYERVGFKQVGWARDVFRIQGQKVNDVSMVLDLGQYSIASKN